MGYISFAGAGAFSAVVSLISIKPLGLTPFNLNQNK